MEEGTDEEEAEEEDEEKEEEAKEKDEVAYEEVADEEEGGRTDDQLQRLPVTMDRCNIAMLYNTC